MENSIVIKPVNWGHVSFSMIEEILYEVSLFPGVTIKNSYTFPGYRSLSKYLGTFIGLLLNILYRPHSLIIFSYEKDYLFPWIHLNPIIKKVWLYDVWPSKFELISNFINKYHFSHLYVSSLQASHKLKDIHKNVLWLPEAVCTKKYESSIPQKNIDVIYFGRKWDWYHEKIKIPLLQNEKTYIYEQKAGVVIAESDTEFKLLLSKSLISICIPASVSHTEKAGNQSTITHRYFQSFASKCLVVGLLPEEGKDLFDYNPIIEIDLLNPENQILTILNNITDYTWLIEKNYQFVLNYHQWRNRLQVIFEHD